MDGNMDGKKRRGFASMDREKQRAIASMGGRAAHAKGTAHEFTPLEAQIAGRKGGRRAAVQRRAGGRSTASPESLRGDDLLKTAGTAIQLSSADPEPPDPISLDEELATRILPLPVGPSEGAHS